MEHETCSASRLLQVKARISFWRDSRRVRICWGHIRKARAEVKSQSGFYTCPPKGNPSAAFTLIETLVAVAIIAMVTLAIYQGYSLVFKLIHTSKEKTAALELASERIEIIRNMPYASIGIKTGVPVGVLDRFAEYTRAGIKFQATTTVRNIDDPFDGRIGYVPNDTSPADYKLTELEIGCKDCRDFVPITVTALAAPRSLETTSGNGALFVSVMDANGNPVPGANVYISSVSVPPIVVNDVTNSLGVLQIVDIPPGAFEYSISVSKTGYSNEQTYDPTAFSPSTPVNPHSTVAAGSLTQLSLAIDRVSTLRVKTVTEACTAVPNIGFTMTGAKKKATGPDVIKTSISSNTGAGGDLTLSSVEWDSYDFSLSGGKLVAGTIPLFPLALSPNASQDVYILPVDSVPNSLLVTVKDSVTGLQISGATVTLTDGAFSASKVTNRGFWNQTDWSGGDSQSVMGSPDRFMSTDGNIEYAATPGEVKLKNILGAYAPVGELVSSWFDFSQSTTTLYTITSSPTSQPPLSGPESVRFQIETTDDTVSAPGNFLGPDGTAATYYTVSTTTVNAIHTNKRYVRYKMYLSTADTSVTPIVSDVSISFGTECTPFGQVYFEGLAPATYDLDVSAPGYTPLSGIPVSVTGAYQAISVSLTP